MKTLYRFNPNGESGFFTVKVFFLKGAQVSDLACAGPFNITRRGSANWARYAVGCISPFGVIYWLLCRRTEPARCTIYVMERESVEYMS